MRETREGREGREGGREGGWEQTNVSEQQLEYVYIPKREYIILYIAKVILETGLHVCSDVTTHTFCTHICPCEPV